MPTSPQFISLELNAIVGALTLANNTLKRVQGQIPPGPPDAPSMTALGVITDLSTQIQTLATAMQAPVGVPGTPP